MAVGKIMVENCIVYIYMWNIRFYRAELRNTRGNFNLFVFEYISKIYYFHPLGYPLLEYFHGFANFLSFSITSISFPLINFTRQNRFLSLTNVLGFV